MSEWAECSDGYADFYDLHKDKQFFSDLANYDKTQTGLCWSRQDHQECQIYINARCAKTHRLR